MEPSANRSPSKGAAMSAKAAENIVTVYKASDVAEMPEIFLNRNGLILVALMAGGDYDVQGLFRCGVKVSGVSGSCPLFSCSSGAPQSKSGPLMSLESLSSHPFSVITDCSSAGSSWIW